tara:strand:- start:857 stop:1399 length:543 start_codon:yes stop_codon:yes gene_type:complete
VELIIKIIDNISSFDLFYLFITLLSLFKCTKNGFVLSILSASKWLLAYIITLYLFPISKPYVIDLIDNDYVLNLILGASIFIIIIFIILMISKSLKKAVRYSGLGSLDRVFGFFFGFLTSYAIAVCIFSTVNIIYNYEKWPINIDKSISFEWVAKGSSYLIKEFPSQKEHDDAKQKIENL